MEEEGKEVERGKEKGGEGREGEKGEGGEEEKEEEEERRGGGMGRGG